jgi:hypothetical protein
VIAAQLIDCQPDNPLINRRRGFGLQGAGDFAGRCAPITLPPNKRRGLVETVSTITLKIIDQGFVG